MRKDLQVALLCAVLSIPVGVVLIAAPEYSPALKEHADIFFWGGIIMIIGLFGSALATATQDDAETIIREHRKRMIPLIGMALSGVIFIGFGVWYFWPDKSKANSITIEEKPELTTEDPALGSVHFETAEIQIAHKISTNETSGQIAIILTNTNNFLIRYRARLSGSINNKKPENELLDFEGFAYANHPIKIYYNTIFGIEVLGTVELDKPNILGRLSYSIDYWHGGGGKLVRTTQKDLRMELTGPVLQGAPGATAIKTSVLFENSKEI